MSHYFFSIGVDSSLSLKREEYFFIYKDKKFRLRPGFKKGETDYFCGEFEIGVSEDDAYKLMCEFLSALAFGEDVRIIPWPELGLKTPKSCSLQELKGGCSQKRSIVVEEAIKDLLTLNLRYIETFDQATLASLYRQARSANNVYLEVLFYWHTLVYPSERDNDGVCYINQNAQPLPSDINYIQEEINKVLSGPILLKNKIMKGSLGKYIKEGIRHSIAHIERKPSQKQKSLELDSLSELSHIYNISTILKAFSRYRLEQDFGLGKQCPPELFKCFDPDKFQ